MARLIHLKPQTDLAPRVLLPGDPHRALLIAQSLLGKPLMFNHHRGLWGYTGTARDGEPLTVQSTGMGGPSAAIVVEELIRLGAKLLVRTGTCGAFGGGFELGELVVVEAAIPGDGASRALGAGGLVEPDPELLARAGALPRVTARSTDLFYDDPGEGGDVVEMESATVLHLARLRGVRAACVLGVSDVPGERIGQEALEDLGRRLGEAGYSLTESRS